MNNRMTSSYERHELDVYGKRGIAMVRGEGSWVFDADGRKYLDCVAGHGAAILGHCHPAVQEALTEQAGRLMSCPGAFYSDVKAAYLERLCSVAPKSLSRVFMANSGAEAVEAALKLARATTGRSNFVAAKGGFHGRTLGALSATFSPKYRKGFEPLVPGFSFVPYNDVVALEQAVDENTAAVILEMVQGEGGVHIGRPDFISAARKRCDATGALLIVDEVQTGFGRTGRLFAFEHHGVVPDLVCLAKGIGAGFPMSAVLAGPKIEIAVGAHGSTFGGNPLACAVGLGVLEAVERDHLVAGAARKGAALLEKLERADLKSVREIRGLGLMIGIELKNKVRPVLGALAEQGILALAAGSTVLRLLPPLVIADEEIDFLAEKLIETLNLVV
jgi:acetylornithine/LysW-gamma-L-lysine aminotransferase